MIWQYSIINKPIIWWQAKWFQKWDNVSVSFGGYTLQDCKDIFMEDWNYDDINKVQMDTYNAPRTDWGGLLGYYINGKKLDFRIILKSDDETDLNNKLDELKKNLWKPNQELKIEINGGFRVWVASMTSFSVNRDFSNDRIQDNIQVSFTALNHWYDEWIQLKTYNNVVGNISLDIENIGTTSAYYKIFIVFSPGNSWVNEVKVLQNWYTLTINQSINDSDILVIDWVEKEVIHNNVNEIDYSWIFQELETGSNPIQIQFNWTVACTVSLLYNPNYL